MKWSNTFQEQIIVWWFRCVGLLYIDQGCFSCLGWAFTTSDWARSKSGSACSGSQLSCPIDVQYNHQVSVRLCVKDQFSILLLKPDHTVVMNAKSLGLEKVERRGCMTSYQGSESCIGRRELLGSLWWVTRSHLPSAQDCDCLVSHHLLQATSSSSLFSSWYLWIPFKIFNVLLYTQDIGYASDSFSLRWFNFDLLCCRFLKK